MLAPLAHNAGCQSASQEDPDQTAAYLRYFFEGAFLATLLSDLAELGNRRMWIEPVICGVNAEC